MKKNNTQVIDRTLEQFDATDKALRDMFEKCKDEARRLDILAAIRENTSKRGEYCNNKYGHSIDSSKNSSDKKQFAAKLAVDTAITAGTTAAAMKFARMVQASEHAFASDGHFYEKVSSDTVRRFVLDPCGKMVGKITDLFHK